MIFDIVVLVFIYLCIYFKSLKRKEKTQILKISILYLYLSLVLFVTILPIDFTLDFKWQHSSINMTYIHLEPFNDLIMGYKNALKQIILNIIMTIPFGFLCCILKKNSTILGVIIKTFLLSFSIEFIQLIMTVFLLHHRSCDITDLITNLIGGIVGFILYKLFRIILNSKGIIVLCMKKKRFRC